MAESRLPNFNTCCRLCLCDTLDNLKSNFVDAAYYPGLQLSIVSLLGVKIVPDDKLSTMVCLQCIEKINNWQSFKLNCCENQTKLEQWMNTSIADLAEMSVHVKEETIDHEKLTSELIIEEDVPVKNESVEEEYNELPPSLIPQGPEEDVEIVPYSPLPHFTNEYNEFLPTLIPQGPEEDAVIVRHSPLPHFTNAELNPVHTDDDEVLKNIKRKPTEILEENESSEYKIPVKQVKGKQRWCDEEIRLLKKHFKSYIQGKRYPSGTEIKEFIKKSGSKRTVVVIRSKIQHLIKLNSQD